MSGSNRRFIKRTHGKDLQFVIQMAMGSNRTFSDEETFTDEVEARKKWKKVKKEYNLKFNGKEEIIDEV